MSFMKRTTFIDDLDREIYVFKMFLDLGEYLYGVDINVNIPYKNGSLYLVSSEDYNLLGYTTSAYHKLFDDNYEIIEIDGTGVKVNNSNLRCDTDWVLNRKKDSPYYHEFEVFHYTPLNEELEDDDEEMDSVYMNEYLINGINNVTEELLFQYSLVAKGDVPTMDYINRVMEVLTTKTSLEKENVNIYHATNINSFSIEELNEMYDVVLDKILEPQYGYRI